MLTEATDALAVYRLVRLLQRDSIFRDQRNWVLGRLEISHPRLAELGDCPFCLSVWVAAGVVVARRAAPRAWGPVAEVLAASAVAGLLTQQET